MDFTDFLDLPPIVTAADLAKLFQVELKTIYRWNQDKVLPPTLPFDRTKRWRRSDIVAWAERREAVTV